MPVGIWKLLGTMTQTSVGFQERQSDGTVDSGLHAVSVQMRGELVAMRMLDSVEEIDVSTIGSELRHDYILKLVEAAIIAAENCSS
jgi:hypothetical protein